MHDEVPVIQSEVTYLEMLTDPRVDAANLGEHETDPAVLAYVEHVLGKQTEES